MVKLRLARVGAKKKPFYRVVVSDSRSPRDGRFIEQIGVYDPKMNPAVFKVKQDRLQHWLSVGAQPTETLHRLILAHREEAQAPASPPAG
jgi:small subunit ribosomal protein S16